MKQALLIALITIFAAHTAAAELTAGAAKVSIVPPFPTHMGGFGDRMDNFEGVNDELFARALAIHDGETAVIVIGSDLMAIDKSLVHRARAAITETTGVPASNILIACAHNHSAPSYYQLARQGVAELPLEDFLVEQFAKAGIDAYESRVPALAGFRAGEITGATSNRQQGNEVVIDSQVGVLKVEKTETREIIAVLYNFTGHPVILGSRNLQLSGEFPGWASRTIESVLGGVAVFTQGACGDITVKREGDPWLEIERLGRLIAGEVIKTAEFIRPTAETTVAAASETLQLAPKPIPDLADAQRALEGAEAAYEQAVRDNASDQVQRQLRQLVDMHSANVRVNEMRAKGEIEIPEFYEAEVQVIRIGDLVAVGIPGEIFVEYALELRQRINQTYGKSMILVGYANDYIGYIVTPRATQTGGYEVSVARVGPDAGRQMTETAIRLLRDMP